MFSTIWEFITGPTRDTLMILERITAMDDNIASLKKLIEKYIATVNAAMEQAKVDVNKAVADAIAKDDADEAVDLQALKQQIDEAQAKLVPPPPPFEPSNQ